MSKAKDRARAESGLIFRDGKLWRKEEWYAANPTKQMLREEQARVAEAVKAELQNPLTYDCAKCGRTHKRGSKIYQQHLPS